MGRALNKNRLQIAFNFKLLLRRKMEDKEKLIEEYFKLKEITITRPDNTLKIEMQTLVTQKGLAYIAKVFEVVQVKREVVKISS